MLNFHASYSKCFQPISYRTTASTGTGALRPLL
jgi:hypothetical protein